ncbi:Phospholipid phosphatase 1 [Bagarius yarrelli]|uniref:Phospholipid phosphatase 1 n=1 Tax=Bagarius yarrelli TaxID=175774 RepID=A0A556U2R1_BAGYA|nr:Phospholipid phosphatase 1 [Bagarius yarrelli]
MFDARGIPFILLDVVCLILAGLPLAAFNLGKVKPYQRGFFCNDESIAYPFHSSTVTSTVLYTVGFTLPICSFQEPKWSSGIKWIKLHKNAAVIGVQSDQNAVQLAEVYMAHESAFVVRLWFTHSGVLQPCGELLEPTHTQKYDTQGFSVVSPARCRTTERACARMFLLPIFFVSDFFKKPAAPVNEEAMTHTTLQETPTNGNHYDVTN